MKNNFTLEYICKTRQYRICEISIVDGEMVTTPIEDAGYEYNKAIRAYYKFVRELEA
jgi:hypothetical protein